MMNYEGLNYLAVLVMAVSGFVIGGIWYGPIFGKAWMAGRKLRPEDLKSPAVAYTVGFVATFILAHTLALLVNTLNLTSAGDGLVLGLYAGLGIIAMSMAVTYAFNRFSAGIFAIEAGYWIVLCLVMGAVLAVWR